jgi:lipoprotein-releasing system permease protein
MRDSWKFTFFIARNLQKQQVEGKKVARPITRIATISIALAMIVNIITIAVVDGFQQEVSRKVIGFGSHISIQKIGEGSVMESSPLLKDTSFIQLLKCIPGVTSVQSVAYKPALLQSSSRDDQKEILGVVLKGVDKSYDWTFFRDYLKEGRLPQFTKKGSNELLISSRIAQDLHYSVGDTVNAFFVKQNPIQRQFKVIGIYETGLEDFDKELAFCDLMQVQNLNDWGITAQIIIDDTLTNGSLVMRADVNGGNGRYRYDWGEGFDTYAGHQICPVKDTVVRLIAADYWSLMNEPTGSTTYKFGETALPDTAYLKITVTGQKMTFCQFNTNEEGEIARTFLDNEGYHFSINAGFKQLKFESFPGKSSSSAYVGSYEVTVADFDNLTDLKRKISKTVTFNPALSQQVQVKSIKDQQQDLFVWLSFLDINMAIVIFLMLVIGIINMGSALLVMILVRTNFIGVLKSLGAKNWLIRKVFLVHFGKLIFKGMMVGNTIGFGLCFLQQQFNIVPLDPKIYYLSTVPISMNWWMVLVLNVTTISVCLAALIIPSYVISKISPSKSIRFR